jgi:hypothetical protein
MKRNAIVFFIKDGDAVSFPIYNNVCSAQIERIRYWRRFSHAAKREANERTKEKVLRDVERCTIRPRQCGRKPAHKSWPASCNQSLGDCIMWTATVWGGGGVQGEASYCGHCLAKTVKRCSARLVYILWMRQYFVKAKLLLVPIFCWCLTFVDANILSKLNFCRRQYSENADILWTPTFCQRLTFVDANILSTPTFLSALIFCWCLFMALIINDCVVYICIMIIINLSKPSLVSTARYLPITVSSTIKVAYDHTLVLFTLSALCIGK